MIEKKKSTDGTVVKSLKDPRVKAERQEVTSVLARAGKKYEKMLSRLSK